jgi:hypothetical protein
MNLFQPQSLKRDEQRYLLEVLEKQFCYFGPFPERFLELADEETRQVYMFLMQTITTDDLPLFARVTERHLAAKDIEFIMKIMKLDWRDRPTAKELLEDEWWQND